MSTFAARQREAEEVRRNQQVRRKHRNAVILRIVAPVALTALIMMAVIVAMIVGFSPRQVGISASFMSMLLIAPLAVLCILPYALLVALVVWTGRAYSWLPPKLRTGRNFAHRANVETKRLSILVSRPIIRLNERFTWAESLVGQVTDKLMPDKPSEPKEE